MAVAFLNSEAQAFSGGTNPFTFGAIDYPAGTLLVINTTVNASSRTVTVSDDSTQPGSANVYNIITPRAGTTMTGMTAWCVVTREIKTATDTITVTPNAFDTRRNCLLMGWSGCAGYTLDVSSTVDNDNASPVSLPSTGTLASALDIAVGVTHWKGGVALSGVTDGTSGYAVVSSGNPLASTTNVEANTSYKLVAGTAAESDAHSYTSITSGCGTLMTFKPGAAPPTARSEIVNVRRVWSGR